MAVVSHPAAEDAELTPIFHALSRWVADPAEFFRRDPLGAPLPSVDTCASMARMLLHAVPAMAGQSGANRAGDAGHRLADLPHRTARPGRHRALRAVQH